MSESSDPQVVSPVVIHQSQAQEEKVAQASVALQPNHPIEVKCEISNKDALRDAIHDIHNFLRNNGAGYGMNALKVFNLIYGLRKIEQHGLNAQLGLSDDCSFARLLALARERKSDCDERVATLLKDTILDIVFKHPQLKHMIYHEIPRCILPSNLSKIVMDVDHIAQLEQSAHFSLSGKIYEYFIGRDESAISELGAYFTDRHIVKYLYDQVAPAPRIDGTVPSMIDMFGGSGGFTIEYINRMNARGPINWETELAKVHHYDMNDDVVHSAALEFFCLSRVLPRGHVAYTNSFTNEFAGMQFDYIFTNPPYGGDKLAKSDKQARMKKIKAQIAIELKEELEPEERKIFTDQQKQILADERAAKKEVDARKVSVDTSSGRIKAYATAHKLDGNDKESVSFILMMSMLAPNGIAVGVLKEGIFFDAKYRTLRQHVIEHFNVSQIVSIDSSQFENTTTKTSAIFFSNTGKTSRVQFKELVVDKATEDKFGKNAKGEITLDVCIGDILNVRDCIVSCATYEQIKASDWDMRGSEHRYEEVKIGEGYVMRAITDMCIYMPKSTRAASFGQSEGKYPFYASSDAVKRCDEADYSEECIIIGNGGVANIKLDSNFSCSDHNYVMRPEPIDQIKLRYVYYLIRSNIRLLEDGFHGSTIKNLSLKYLDKLKIPVPSDEKRTYWVARISEQYNAMITARKCLMESEQKIRDTVTALMIAPSDEIAIGDVSYFSIHQGKRIVKSRSISGNVPVYGGGDAAYYIDSANRERNTLIIAIHGMSIQCVRFIREPFYMNDNGCSLKVMNQDIAGYVYGYMLLPEIQMMIYGLSAGSIQRHLQMDQFKKFTIKVPKNRAELARVNVLWESTHTFYDQAKDAETAYEQLLIDLSNEAFARIPSTGSSPTASV